MMTTALDSHFMEIALAQAHEAAAAGEVPVGAVVVKDGQVIATGRNGPIGGVDPTAHAEIVALRAAARVLNNYRLDGCELYVTLEPCAMCTGAILHARLHRVIFGAADPKTGAAGSIVNLFAHPRLNHHTELLGGVNAQACADVLQDFFQRRRQDPTQRSKGHDPLRDDALRTSAVRFEGLPDYPWQPHFCSDLPSLAGLRMHYLDEGLSAGAQQTYLCIHGNPTWSYLYRKMIPVFVQGGHRVVAPDLIGFGKSDKPKKESIHSFAFHRQTLLELVERLDLHEVILVLHGWGGGLGLTLPMAMPERFKGLLLMNTMFACSEQQVASATQTRQDGGTNKLPDDLAQFFARSVPYLAQSECDAYAAPFPHKGYRAATRAFAPLFAQCTEGEGAAVSRDARAFLQNDWRGKSLMAVGMRDTLLGETAMDRLRYTIAGCPERVLLPDCGHFVPEMGASLAQRALAYFANADTSPSRAT